MNFIESIIMTLSMAWVRKQSTTEELVMATDSRLRAGYAWDTAPKIFTFSRGDCAICFAGSTDYSYPIMEQIRNSIETYEKSKSRALDLYDLQGYLRRIVHQMQDAFHDFPQGQERHDDLDVTFIFAGFSWRKQKFSLWLLNYNYERNQFTFSSLDKLRSQNENSIVKITKKINHLEKSLIKLNILLSNTQTEDMKNKYNSQIEDTKKRILNKKEELYICSLNKILFDKNIILIGDNDLEAKQEIANKIDPNSNNINYEPFEVLRDFCRDETKHHIGGSPQIIKIYKHLNTMPYAVYWPNKVSQTRTLFGRPLIDFENPNYMTFDPDKLIAEDFTPNSQK